MTKKKKAGNTRARQGSEAKTLSAKEMEILRRVQEGKTTDEIALILGKSKWTAKYHINNIFRKLNATNRASAVNAAVSMGVISPIGPPSEHVFEEKKVKIGIVGCGKGGTAILN